MSCIHFKFKSNLEYEKVSFGGLQISLGELKEAIMKQKKIGGANQYSLSVRDAQSKKLYKDDNEMVSRNSSVIISRVPLVNAPKIPKTQNQDPSLPQPASSRATTTGGIPSTALPALTSASETVQDGKLSAEQLAKMPDLSKANATEEEKMIAMMNQSAEDYNPSRYVKFAGPRRGGGVGGGGVGGGGMMTRPPPPTYRCYRCGQQGHFINQCPTNGDPKFDNYRYKPVRGTPSNQLIPAPGDVQGAMMDRHGNLVVRAVDYQAFLNSQMKGKKTGAAMEAPKEAKVPPELLCHLCKELVRDAVIIPCCGESFCYECIQDHLCEKEFTCPMCKASDVSPERLAPNKALRTAAKNFQLKAAEEKSEAVARGFVKQAPLAIRLPAPTPTPSQSPHTTAKASTILTTSATQSQDSTSTTITEINSPRNNNDTTDGPSDKTASEAVTNSTAAAVSESNTMVTPASPPTPCTPDSPLLAEANLKLEKIMLNGLAGISSAGSVPVIKMDPRAHLLRPGVYPPAHLLAPTLLPQPRLTSAADLLLSHGKTSPSPPPLSADEFYRQQKLLKLLTKKTGSRSNTPGSNSSWSGSNTGSNSRSRSRSWSYDSRSRSRSPHQKKHKTTSRKIKTHAHKRSRHVQERETEYTTKHRSHRKRPHSREKKEEVSKRTTKRHRSRSVSPDRKRSKVDVALSRTDGPSEGEENGSHKHKNKKRSKRKHRHSRSTREEGEAATTPSIDAMEVGESQSQEQGTSEPSSIVDTSEASSLKEAEQVTPDVEGKSLETSTVQEPDSDELNNNNNMEKADLSILVPDQDSSTIEVEQNEDTQTAVSSDVDDGVLVEVHIDGDIDGLDQELGVVLGVVTPETETDKEEGGGKEDGEISDSGGSRPITPYVAQQASHTPKPLSPEEDLRAEIERAKKKRELDKQRELENIIEPLPSSIPLEPIPIPETIVHTKKVKKRKPAPVISSDEYDSSSSSSESEDSEAERIARKKLQKLKQRSKRKHSSSSKSRDRREKEKAVKSKKKKEHSRSKKDSRDRKIKKAAKLHRDEYKIRKVDKAKKSKSSRH